jgi:hypothetical protein
MTKNYKSTHRKVLDEVSSTLHNAVSHKVLRTVNSQVFDVVDHVGFALFIPIHHEIYIQLDAVPE